MSTLVADGGVSLFRILIEERATVTDWAYAGMVRSATRGRTTAWQAKRGVVGISTAVRWADEYGQDFSPGERAAPRLLGRYGLDSACSGGARAVSRVAAGRPLHLD